MLALDELLIHLQAVGAFVASSFAEFDEPDDDSFTFSRKRVARDGMQTFLATMQITRRQMMILA